MTRIPDWDRSLLPAGAKLLCALSGGADSMCLLDLLRSGGYSVAAAHYNHGLRGEEAERDERFVTSFCRDTGVELVVGRGDVRAYAAEHGMGLEEAARELRYRFLEETADSTGCTFIATAHNASDNAETMLLNFARGSGTKGLCGIPPQRGRLVRPLLRVTHEEIVAYLTERGIPWVEDSSNASDDFSRNRIRHQVLPVLTAVNPDFLSAAGRTAQLLREDEDCLSALAAEFLAAQDDGESIPLRALGSLHPAVASRVVRALCPKSLSMQQVRAVLALAGVTERKTLDLPGLRLRAEQGRLYYVPETPCSIPERVLPVPGELLIPETGLLLKSELTSYAGEIHDLLNIFYLKYEKLQGSVLTTGRREGDRLRPAGRGCTKSLKSLFLEKQMPRAARDATVVLRDREGILAAIGLAMDERTLPMRGDKALRITIQRIGR